MTTPIIFEAIIFFYCLSLFNACLQRDRLTVSQKNRTATLVDFYVQDLVITWNELLSKSPFTDFSKALARYMPVDINTGQFEVLAAHFEGLSPPLQQMMLVDLGDPLRNEECVYTAAFDRPANRGHVLRCVTYLMSDRLHALMLNCGLYSKEGKCYDTLQSIP